MTDVPMSDCLDSLRDIGALWYRTHSVRPGSNEPAAEFARDVRGNSRPLRTQLTCLHGKVDMVLVLVESCCVERMFLAIVIVPHIAIILTGHCSIEDDFVNLQCIDLRVRRDLWK